MDRNYCIIYNPLIFELMDLINKKNLVFEDLITFLSDRPVSGLSEKTYLDYLDFNLEKERKGLLEYSGMEFYASYYIANQVAFADSDLRIYLCDGKRKTIKDIIIREGKKPFAVFISSLSSNFPATACSSVILNHAEIPVIIGGIHISTRPEDADTFIRNKAPYPELISTVKGPGDSSVIQAIIGDLKNNSLKPSYLGKISIENGMWGNKNIIELPGQNVAYLKKFPVVGRYLEKHAKAMVTTPYLGCPYSCTFCSISTLPRNQRTFVSRNPEDFLNEIKYYQREGVKISNRYFMFLPDNLLLGGKKLEEILDRMIKDPLKINYATQISIDIAKDRNLLHKLRRSGATHFLIGFESLNVKNLEYIGKNILKEIDKNGLTVKEYYANQIKIIQAHGISIVGAFIFGLPYDYFNSIDDHSGKEIVDFCLENKIGIQASCLNDLPGSMNFNASQEENTFLYGAEGTMQYLMGLSTSDLTECNRKISASLKRSPLVPVFMAYDTIRKTNAEYTVLKHALSLTKNVLKAPTQKAEKNWSEKFYDVLGLFGCMLGQSGYKDHFEGSVFSGKNGKGTFKRLYELEKDTELKEMFKKFLNEFE